MHGFEKPHDERGLGLMNAAAVVRGICSVQYLILSKSSHCMCLCLSIGCDEGVS